MNGTTASSDEGVRAAVGPTPIRVMLADGTGPVNFAGPGSARTYTASCGSPRAAVPARCAAAPDRAPQAPHATPPGLVLPHPAGHVGHLVVHGRARAGARGRAHDRHLRRRRGGATGLDCRSRRDRYAVVESTRPGRPVHHRRMARRAAAALGAWRSARLASRAGDPRPNRGRLLRARFHQPPHPRPLRPRRLSARERALPRLHVAVPGALPGARRAARRRTPPRSRPGAAGERASRRLSRRVRVRAPWHRPAPRRDGRGRLPGIALLPLADDARAADRRAAGGRAQPGARRTAGRHRARRSRPPHPHGRSTGAGALRTTRRSRARSSAASAW